MLESIKTFWNQVGRKNGFWIPVLFFTISTYGFSIFNRTVGIDDLAADLYVGSGNVMIAAGRWGMILWNKLAAIPRLSPASDRLLAATFLLAASILLSGLFYHVRNDKQNRTYVCKYTVLSCFLITYPILGEIWEYSGANYMSTGGMLVSIVTCYYLITRWKVGIKEVLVAGVLMTLPMSGYEAGVLFYITLVCALLFYQFCLWGDRNRKNLYCKNAILFALPLVIALFLRWGIGNLLRLILRVEKGFNGATGIAWGNAPFSDVLRKVIIDTTLNYVVNGIVYLPITFFLFAELFLFGYSVYLAIKKRSSMILARGVLLAISVFILPIMQGTFMQYRTAIPLSMLVSFSLFCLLECYEGTGIVKRATLSVLAFYLIWVQSAYLNSELALNNQRSENEMRTMSVVAQKILSIDSEKPVIFVGEYDTGEYFKQAKKEYVDSVGGDLYQKIINAFKNRFGDYYYTFFHLTEFPDSNVNSVSNYSLAVNGMMENYLAYLGYDIDVIDRNSELELVEEAKDIAQKTGMRSYEVQEEENYIIATLQLG